MFNNKLLAPIYLIAFISCVAVFYEKREWGWLVAAGVWLALSVFYFIKYNKSDNDLKK